MSVPAVLFFDATGRIVALTPNAGCFLRELGARGDRWSEGDALPLPVQLILTALSPGSDLGARAVPRLRIRALSGDWLSLFGALTEETPGRPVERVIVIAREQEGWWRALQEGEVAHLPEAIDNGYALGQEAFQPKW